MIWEFIASNTLLSIVLTSLAATLFFMGYLQTGKLRYGLAVLLLIGGFVFFGLEHRIELDQQARTFCLDKGLKPYDWSNRGSEILCYETTNGSAEIITFKKIHGKMYRINESLER